MKLKFFMILTWKGSFASISKIQQCPSKLKKKQELCPNITRKVCNDNVRRIYRLI